jgi:hypothetical protein
MPSSPVRYTPKREDFMSVRCLSLALAVLGLAACSGPTYLNRDVVTVAVLPPWNDTSMVEASGKMWPHVEHEAATHRYRILPRAQVEAYFKKLRFNTPEEIQQIKPQKICAELQVQGLVYSRITAWGKTTTLTSFSIGVECDVWLTEGATGEQAWTVSGKAGKQGRDSLEGLWNSASALVGNPAEYAPKAAANAFKTVPLAGFAPGTN